MMQKFMMLTILLAFTVIFACRNASEKRAERIAEKIMEKASGEEVDVDIDSESFTIKTEDGTLMSNVDDKKWPSGIPEEVPEFSFGSVEQVISHDMDDGKMWTMMVEKVPADVLTKYQKELKKNGFTCNMVSHNNEEGMLSAEKGDINVAVMAGEGSASVSVAIEKK
jgi:hypothetical protein